MEFISVHATGELISGGWGLALQPAVFFLFTGKWYNWGEL